MSNNLSQKEVLLLGGLAMLAFFVKCYFNIMAPLLDDEVYYFIWSQKPDFGYPEHGPFLPWIYALISPLLGESAFAIRFFALFGMQIVSISVFFFMKNRFGNRAAWISFLTYQLLPATFTLSIVSTIDTPMFIFGTYSLLFYCKGFFEDKKFFYVGGLFLGVSALSKVSAIWLGVGMFFYIIFSERRNDYFKNPHLWLSFFLAALIYSPFLLWNYVNDFPFFVTATNLLSREGSVESFLFFWISQILLLFPSIFVLIFHALNSNLMKNYPKNLKNYYSFFSMLGVVALCYIFYQSLRSNLEANWGGFAYISLLLLGSIHISQVWEKFAMKYFFSGSLILSTFIMFFITGHTLFGFLPVQKHDFTNRYYAFKTFPEEIKDYYASNLNPEIRTISFNNYQIPSMLDFHVKPINRPVSVNGPDYHPVVFEYWYPNLQLKGQDLYVLQNSLGVRERMKESCEEFSMLKKFVSTRETKNISEHFLFICKKFSGKMRALPTFKF
ncbi:MAG TPA: glycosyltransferase family 39 protein [SAR324 cluster bacterium]|jgi:4-amino-4-deoxy-L-arabinose transferase-like glycosyltransferase|nr:glycosyltransferase family 39 protein [SAR324 cluster bacterium]